MASKRKSRKMHSLSDDDSDRSNGSDELVSSFASSGAPGGDEEGGDRQAQKQQSRLDRKYSIEKYRSLLDYFRDVQVLTPEAVNFIVSKVRLLHEFLIYGQKTEEPIYFEEFIEDNVC